jgi:sister-chromatid-cohesion protein PDS5
MESAFARLLSLLAHHPDYPTEAETEEKLLAEWKDHAKYIIYYLDTVSTEENLGLIYKYAERVKQARDAIDPTQSERLYVLSDLAQAIIRVWEVKKGWRIRIFPGKVLLSSTLFAALPSHEVAQEIAEKDYLPEGIDDESLEGLVRNYNKQVN